MIAPFYLRVLAGAGAALAALTWAGALGVSGLLRPDVPADCFIWGASFIVFVCGVGRPGRRQDGVRSLFYAYACDVLLLMGKALCVQAVCLTETLPAPWAALAVLTMTGAATHLFYPSVMDRFLTAALVSVALISGLLNEAPQPAGAYAAWAAEALIGAGALYGVRRCASSVNELPYGVGLAAGFTAGTWLCGHSALPGLPACALFWVQAALTGRKKLMHAAAIGAFGFAGVLYYETELSLDKKALLLGLFGAALLTLRFAMTRGLSVSALKRDPSAFVALAPAALFLAGGSWYHERIINEGQTLLLPLKPVDPRGFLVGDFMRLSYEAEDFPCPAEGEFIFRTDSLGVGRPVSTGIPEGEGFIRLRCGERRGRVRVGPSAYYFPEGEAARFAEAKYGVFKVKEGTGVLTGLADARGRSFESK